MWVKWKSLSRVQLFTTTWTIQSMEFFRPEYSLSLLQGIFLTQESNPGLSHYRWILCQLIHNGSPRILEWVAYPFSSRSSWPRNQTGVSYNADGFFTNWAMSLKIMKITLGLSTNLIFFSFYKTMFIFLLEKHLFTMENFKI